MNIIYCREHSPPILGAVGDGIKPGTHTDGDKVHTDLGVITVKDDLPKEGESMDDYSARIQKTYQKQFK